MTREEAIDVVKERLDYHESEKRLRAACELLIPELRESEDERIRKRLVEYFKGFYDSFSSWNNVHWEGLDVKKVIAYLEKQKEQNPAEWSNTDKIGWDEAFACVTRAEKAAKNEEELQNAVTAEKWLKEIKFKYYVHPVKQEWSEEDTEMYINVASSLRGYACGLENEEHKRHIQKGLDWLENRFKSLRPQPRWKPSEEQISALEKAIIRVHSDDEIPILCELRQQLKKLM